MTEKELKLLMEVLNKIVIELTKIEEAIRDTASIGRILR